MQQTAFDAAEFVALRGLAPPGLRLTAEPLTGGYWNQVVRVQGRGLDLVVKRFHPGRGPRRFPNLPAAEAAALKRRFAGEDFAAAPERVAPGGAECGQTRTDGQLVTLTFRGGASERRVTLDTRCLSPAADRLRDLADAVDATARSRAFLR